MSSPLVRVISRVLSCYLRQEVNLEELHEWLTELIWEIESDSDKAAEKLAYGVELLIAEHSHGHRTEASLRTEVQLLIPSDVTYEDRLNTTAANEPSSHSIFLAVTSHGWFKENSVSDVGVEYGTVS